MSNSNSNDNPMGSAASGGAPSKQPDASKLKRRVSQESTTQLNVKIPESLHKRLKIRSVETGREMRELAAEALDSYLSE